MEILAGDNVCRRLRPTLGHFHVFLAEDGRALLVRDQGGAFLPLDRVKRRLLPIGKIPLEDQTFPQAAPCFLCSRIGRRGFSGQCLLHGCHLSLALSGIPSQARGTLLFYSSALGRGAALCFRVRAESSATRSLGLVRGASEKKADCQAVALKMRRESPMHRRWPVTGTQPNSRCSAKNTGAEQVLRARFYSLKTRAA